MQLVGKPLDVHAREQRFACAREEPRTWRRETAPAAPQHSVLPNPHASFKREQDPPGSYRYGLAWRLWTQDGTRVRISALGLSTGCFILVAVRADHMKEFLQCALSLFGRPGGMAGAFPEHLPSSCAYDHWSHAVPFLPKDSSPRTPTSARDLLDVVDHPPACWTPFSAGLHTSAPGRCMNATTPRLQELLQPRHPPAHED